MSRLILQKSTGTAHDWRHWGALFLACLRARKIRRRQNVQGGSGLWAGNSVRIKVDAQARLCLGKGIWIGDQATLTVEGCGCLEMDSRVSVNEHCHVVCSGRLILGADVGINNHTVIHCHGDAVIGADTMIGAYTFITDSGHCTDDLKTPMRLQGNLPPTPLVIGEDVWIGTKVTITRGVTIGKKAIIGANAVVTQDIGAYEVWGGVPARFLKMRPGAEHLTDRAEWMPEKLVSEKLVAEKNTGRISGKPPTLA